MPAFTRRQFVGGAVPTVTTSSLGVSDTSVTLAATTGWPSGPEPFYIVLSPGSSAEEKCLATISGSTLTLTRAQDDTSAQTHASGSTVYPVFTANDADEANEVASKLTTKGDLLVTTGSVLNRLAVGTNGHVLTADSAETNGVKWAQVVAGGIASNAVTTAKILDGNVTTAKIADANVTTAKLATGLTVTLAAGSAGAPSLTTTGDTNTGVLFPGADRVQVATGGVARIEVDASGQFVAGTVIATQTRAANSPGSGNDDDIWLISAGPVTTVSCGTLNSNAGIFRYDRATSSTLVQSNDAGGVVLGSQATSWASNSDETMKNIHSDIQNAVSTVNNLRSVYFSWKSDETDKPQVGLIAQDFVEHFPEALDQSQEKLMLRYTDVIPLLVAAVKELSAEVKLLKGAQDAE